MAILAEFGLASDPVGFPPVSDSNNIDNELVVFDLVEHAIHAAAQPVLVIARQFG